MQISYGKDSAYLDITESTLRFCCDGERIQIPGDDVTRAQIFSDPLYGVVKEVVVVTDENGPASRTVYPAGAAIDLALSAGAKQQYLAIDRPGRPTSAPAGASVEQIIEAIHQQLAFAGGRLTDELPEQSMVVRFLDPGAKVLEIGSNVGRNTLMIASRLTDPTNFVTMECDPNSVALLRCNRQANGFDFHIEPSALSYRRLIQRGWETVPAEELLPGYQWVSTITFEELLSKYQIAFDTLVADCEGALFYILQDNPAMLDGISTVILEADYMNVDHKRSVEAVFTARGFHRVHSEPLVTDWNHPFPDEVAASFFEVWRRG